MLADLQMIRLTCAAMLEHNDKLAPLAEWRHHIPGPDKAGGDKRFKLQDGNSLNDYRRNHHSLKNQ